MLSLSNFGLDDMAEFGAALRTFGTGVESMEAVADRVSRHIYDSFGDGASGDRSCVLVRFYKTHPYLALDDSLRAFADRILGEVEPAPGMKCMTLLASAGDEPAWNSRQESVGHRAIPLASESFVSASPMIAQLVTQFGLDLATVVEPDPAVLVDLQQRTFNVFHVPEALGSPYIPAQDDFVVPYGVQSVLGFGGMLPSGDLVAVIMFSRTVIPRETGELFKTLALSVKLAVLPFDGGRVFSP